VVSALGSPRPYLTTLGSRWGLLRYFPAAGKCSTAMITCLRRGFQSRSHPFQKVQAFTRGTERVDFGRGDY